jgi:hypothetical protein
LFCVRSFALLLPNALFSRCSVLGFRVYF